LNISGYRFRPGWLMTVVTLAALIVTVSAGNWQRGRAQEKEALQRKLDAWAVQAPVNVPTTRVDDNYAYRRVQAVGRYDARHAILLDNKVYRNQAGYHVVTPLRLGDSDMHVLVVRGWAPGGRTRADVPRVATPEGVQHVEGIASVPSQRVLELAKVQPGYVWQNLLLDRYAAWTGLKLQPFVILQTNDAGDGLVRDWPRPDAGIDKHKMYAAQWYLFAALSVILYVVLNVKRQ